MVRVHGAFVALVGVLGVFALGAGCGEGRLLALWCGLHFNAVFLSEGERFLYTLQLNIL